MRADEALKETEKIHRGDDEPDAYAMLDGVTLTWYRKSDNVYLTEVSFKKITDDNWQPYHEVKEIRPEKAGELWRWMDGYYHTDIVTPPGRLGLVGKKDLADAEKVVHGKEGWTRLFPPVEDDSVERIEIEGVEFASMRLLEGEAAYVAVVNGGFAINNSIAIKPPMKMILEIPKDKS